MKLDFVRLEWKEGGTQYWLDEPRETGMAFNRRTGDYIQNDDGQYLYVEPNELIAIFVSPAPYEDFYRVKIDEIIHNCFNKRKNITISVRKAVREEMSKSEFRLVSKNSHEDVPLMRKENAMEINGKVCIDGLRLAIERAIRKIDP